MAVSEQLFSESGAPPALVKNAPALDAVFRQLQTETLAFAIAGLFGGTLALLALGTRAANPAWALVTVLTVLALLLLAWFLRVRSFAFTATLLVLAALVAVGGMTLWGSIPAGLSLLMIPVGLATVLLGVGWGSGLATICTLGMASLAFFDGYLPAHLPLGQDQRLIAVALMWATVGMLWIALRPLLTAVEWSWSHFQKSQRALEQARDAQVQLTQVLEDLSSANVQLTRLNQLAHALREEAESARRAKEEFVANVSHELRTPLNMIIGFSRMIVQTPQVYGKREIPPALLSDLTVVLRNSQHLARLVDDVLDLSQIEADRMALTKERTDLGEIVENALAVVRPLFDSKKLVLEHEIEAHLPALFIDRTRISEVLLNLLSNAGRFTEEGGVKVTVAVHGEEVLFGVADTGPGIASADMTKLFRPFQQLDVSLSRKHGGTGLGLTLSKRFVELHDGRMWLESNVGKGSTFFFTLPVERTQALPTSGPARWISADWNMLERTRPSLAPAPETRQRFVVLDAAGTLSRLVTRYLDNYEIITVTDLAAAVAALAEMPAQALLVADGNAVAARPGEICSTTLADVPDDVPVLLCPISITTWSTSAKEGHRSAGGRGPGSQLAAPSDGEAVSDYLVKPISQEALMAAVTETLNARDIDPEGLVTILLVDDEPDELRLFWRMIAASGRRYRVLTAANGVEAMALLRDERPHLIVTDLMMPEMDGFQLAVAKNADPELREIPLLIVSARDPQGQPIVAESVTAIRGGGLSVPQLLACVQALSQILSPLPAPETQA